MVLRPLVAMLVAVIINSSGVEEIIDKQNEYWITCGKAYEYNDGLLESEIIDDGYDEKIVELTDEEKEAIRTTVLGEARGEGFIGMALVMQAIKDTMIEEECSAIDVINKYGYVGKYTGEISDKTEERYNSALEFIFVDGKYVVKHRVKYFYAFKSMTSAFHERQTFIVKYGGHKFFY